jgi:hypothetical protein|tara:strand:- start:2093 stop:2287 length:195 start_codon:yes stop_codon:yes gene_type:complete
MYNDLIKERVIKSDFKKVYSLEELSKWIEYGINKGVIKKSGKKEDVELLLKWIELLNKNKNINL